MGQNPFCACTKTGLLQLPQSQRWVLLFWLLELFAGPFNLKEGTSGLFLQICVHASKCVHLTPQGVCPIWSVLANFILLCLHGKRSQANIETQVTACFALKLPEHWPVPMTLNEPFGLLAYKS